MQNSRMGFLAILLGSVCFSINDVSVKLFSSEYALHQLMFFRALFAIAILIFFILPFYGGFNYRVELVEMFITPKGTKNVNANFHVDGDNPGSLKMMIYLTDVDEKSGPISFLSNKDNQVKKILGDKGTVVFFNNRKARHAGIPSISKDRTVLTFLLYPTLRKNINYIDTKPMNVFCNINPFSKFS